MAESPEQQFSIQRIYCKDISFESPNSPAVFTGEWRPEVNIDINTGSQLLADDVYEVVLTVTTTAKQDDKTNFLAEVQQAGIFQISGFEEEQMGAMLSSYCPNLLFPFAREAIADLVNKGSFPQLLLAPINFDALYAQHLQQQAEAQDEATDAPKH